MKCVDDFRLTFDKKEYVPIMIGGMGVDISTSDLSLTAARLGGIGHISDAMVPTVSDRRYDTKYVRDKLKKYKHNVANEDKSDVQFDLALLEEAAADGLQVLVLTCHPDRYAAAKHAARINLAALRK